MLDEHLGAAIISRFRTWGPKVLKVLMFVRVVNENLPITRASRRGQGRETSSAWRIASSEFIEKLSALSFPLSGIHRRTAARADGESALSS